jgi:hypothetical protein
MNLTSETSQMLLIDQVLPAYDFHERHYLDIEAPPDACYRAARNLDFSQSRIIKTLFVLRGLGADALSIEAMTTAGGFTLVEEAPPAEFVLEHEMTSNHGSGDQPNPHRTVANRTVANRTVANRTVIAWNFRTETLSTRTTRLHTETRVACSGRSKLVFGAYWLAIKPFSGLVRREMLRLARDSAERPNRPS